MDMITHLKRKRKQESGLERTTQGLYHLSHVKHIFKMGKAYRAVASKLRRGRSLLSESGPLSRFVCVLPVAFLNFIAKH